MSQYSFSRGRLYRLSYGAIVRTASGFGVNHYKTFEDDYSIGKKNEKFIK